MASTIYLRIDSPDGFDYSGLMVDLANRRPVSLAACEIGEIRYPVQYFKEEILQEMAEHGFTTFLNIGPLNEELTRPSTPPDVVLATLKRFLTNIGVDTELIIVDPYFFPPRASADYSTRVLDALAPFLGQLSDLRIVTSSRPNQFSETTKTAICGAITGASASLRIHHTQNDELHDRFWISNRRTKGVLAGTSLNGLGRKYALIDYLEDADVTDIVSEFATLGLI